MWNRRLSLILTIISLTLSITLLLGVDYIRKETKSSFLNTLSGTDLIVGARSGSVQLLLYSVFRIGNATNNISWNSYQAISNNPLVKWTIPLSLGDSHKGYRVLGTNQDYFKYYQYGNKQNLVFATGQPFNQVYEVVLGAEVAKKLGYTLNSSLIIAHGTSATEYSMHKDKPFKVIGILKPTGTPVDRTVHIPLEGIEAIHIDWVNGAKVNGYSISAEDALQKSLQPKVITAFLVGLNNRVAAFRVQREINDYQHEPLLAILPGVALADLWQALGIFETVLKVITGFVVGAGLLGMLTTLLSTLNERRREMAILRAMGAHPYQVGLLLMLEAVLLAFLGCVSGAILLSTLIVVARPWVMSNYGFYLAPWLPSSNDLIGCFVILIMAIILSLIPSMIAYKRTLQDGLSVKV
jgi:putative ABC transport system permease protein